MESIYPVTMDYEKFKKRFTKMQLERIPEVKKERLMKKGGLII